MAVIDSPLPVRFTLLSSEEGGRRGPIRSGYRPSFWLGRSQHRSPMLYDAALTLVGQPWLEPGESADAELAPSLGDAWEEVTSGQTLPCYEGSRLVGEAVVAVTSQGADELRAAVQELKPQRFEFLVSVLISKIEKAERLPVAANDGVDVAVRHHGGATVYQVKSGRTPAQAHGVVVASPLRAFPDLQKLYLVTQTDPKPAALHYLERIARELSVPVGWYTSDWVVEQLLALPDVTAYFLGGGREVVYEQLRKLRNAWAYGAASEDDVLSAIRLLNRQNPFLDWVLSAPTGSVERRLITKEKYPGARDDAQRESIAA